LQLNSVSSGQYNLIVDAINGSGDTQQLTGAFTLKSNQPKEYDFVYPDSIENYKDGTLVLGSDGNVYQCRPFPYEGWCTVAAPHYVPGEGSDWEDAWILLD
jgi:chitin-binding protein